MQDANYYSKHPESLEALRIRGMSGEEKETVITFADRSGTATIATSDNVVFSNLKKRPAFHLVHLNWGRAADGPELHEAIFEGPADLIRFANPVQKRPLTDAQREALKSGRQNNPFFPGDCPVKTD